MLPHHVDSILINTGNLISSKEFKRKASQSPTEEVFDSVIGTFHTWLEKLPVEDIPDSNSVHCINEDHVIKVEKDDRITLKVTVKVFLENFQCEDLKSSVEQAMDHLNITLIDSLILSLPPLPAGETLTLDHIKPLWRVLEDLVKAAKAVTIGISDLDTPQLAELYNWTEVKPSVNQVNLESCCVMPPEMTAFAKDNDIQLLTHNDPKVILPHDMLSKILAPAVETPQNWKMSWMVRYSVVVKCRGIIQNKGYILYSTKQLETV